MAGTETARGKGAAEGREVCWGRLVQELYVCEPEKPICPRRQTRAYKGRWCFNWSYSMGRSERE